LMILHHSNRRDDRSFSRVDEIGIKTPSMIWPRYAHSHAMRWIARCLRRGSTFAGEVTPTRFKFASENMTYQFTWTPMLQGALGCSGGVPGKGEEWFKAFGPQIPALMQRAAALDIASSPGSEPRRRQGQGAGQGDLQGHPRTVGEVAKGTAVRLPGA
jgi:hypothetical protein